MQAYLQDAHHRGLTVGFVPTMGALHQGHLSLIAASNQVNDITVVSIFVNPAQFNDKKDFEQYPVTIEKDIEWLVAAGAGVLFLPAVTEIYPPGLTRERFFDLGYLETVLEGKYRPGHFQGVCKVMNRLLDIVQADDLYMGQKDYQQCMVVKRLLAIMQSPTRLHTCPTLREKDGLAMSSRNTRLGAEQRKNALAIYAALNYIKGQLRLGSTQSLTDNAAAMLTEKDFNIDYVTIADAGTLEPVTVWDGKQQLVALIAAFQKEVRLIDNMIMN